MTIYELMQCSFSVVILKEKEENKSKIKVASTINYKLSNCAVAQFSLKSSACDNISFKDLGKLSHSNVQFQEMKCCNFVTIDGKFP